MLTQTILLVAAMVTAVPVHTPATMFPAPVGGPPTILIAGKARGDISRADWEAARSITLAGCVPDARVVSHTVRLTLAKGGEQVLTGKAGVLGEDIKKAVSALPAGSTFTVSVQVVDGRKKEWEVPAATYVLRG